MGVYIKGMDMPKGDNWITVRIYSDGTCGRPDAHGDCTLYNGAKAVPVPPHGRLGDLDEIERYKERLVVDADKIKKEIRYVVDTKYIKEAPTIIPAEEEKFNG